MQKNVVLRNGIIFWWLGLGLQLSVILANSLNLHKQKIISDRIQADHLPSSGMNLIKKDDHVVMSNGIVSITLTVPGGDVTSVSYNGSDNLLLTPYNETERGYWDVAWENTLQGPLMIDNLEGTSFKVIVENETQIELSFTRAWNTSDSSHAPLNIDKRYVMLRDSPGFYSYAVLERLKGWPIFFIQEGRIVFRLQKNIFNYMAISDERQRFMPTAEDRDTGEVLDYPEAVLLTNPANPHFKGEVDDKYLYSCDDKDNKVHGWTSTDKAMGFWMITPSDEFRIGGPFKQDLTSHIGPFSSHVGPVVLSMFMSRHYAGDDTTLKFQTQEYWKKVFGPVYIYLNSDASAKTNPSVLWSNAVSRMHKEVANWPYSFPLSQDFVKSDQRGAVSGQLLVYDQFVNKQAVPAKSAYVGLAPPGATGSWQFENKGYQFWTQTDMNGNFLIKNVIPGTYNLFAWVPGTLGDYRHSSYITITAGAHVKATNVIFKAPRNGPTLWEIGIPDRSAAEYFIPDPDPRFKIHPYKHKIEKFRQYGLWERYTDLYPKKDLVFTVGTSNFTKDWFFAHVTRKTGNRQYAATTWQVLFDLKTVNKEANYTLQLALASAHNAELQVRLNDPKCAPYFSTGQIGMDNAVGRHGIRGLYHFYSILVAGNQLVVGRNTLFLTQSKHLGPFEEVMYDYIRLEGPSPTH